MSLLWLMGAAAAGGSAPPSTQGELYGCGDNTYGQLGNGTTTTISTPVQVGALDTWSDIAPASYIFGTLVTTGAIRADNTLWTWGDASNGMNGRGDLLDVSSPVQVGALTDWAYVAAGTNVSFGVRTDGTLWAWGQNTNGQLGVGDSTSRSSPTQIGALTDWSKVETGPSATEVAHTIGLKTNGTIFTWGNAAFGQLGLGPVPGYKSSPVQVGAATDWSNVYCANRSTFAYNAAGELWATGNNASGMWGLGIAENNYDDLIKIADYPTFTKGSSAISSNLIIR